ncbi:dammarenediol II synthase-like [Olea europaea subsp. europaea]|uniref:Dammarenediol II synthase-like n=1 Tax=Olea europaea subsp. europaea TaxID=158383 RepID=A0A8S0V544_OLEEU|nr:dammarenediol II synthase-like [Olea europaea subsp. europaea]
MIGSTLSYIALCLLGEGPDDGNGRLLEPANGSLILEVQPEFPHGKRPIFRQDVVLLSYYIHAYVIFVREKISRATYQSCFIVEKQDSHQAYNEIKWNKARHDCCKEDLYYPHSSIQDLLWDTLNYYIEPVMRRWPLNKIRQRALDKIIKYMGYGAEESRYITIGCVEKSLQMMCWWAHDPNGDEFKHHLARVPDYLWLAEDGMKIEFGSQIWDSTLATQAVIAIGMVEEYGDCLKKAHFYVKESQINPKENPAGDFKSMYRHFTKGAWTFSDQDQGWVVSDCTAEALKCLLLLSQMPIEIAGEKADVERLYEAVNVLLYLQSPESGGFAIWEPPVPQPYFQMLNPSEIFADIAALLTFKRLYPGHREKEIEISVAKAISFLERRQWPDGSWYGYWGICFLYGTFFVLGGLSAAGKTCENSEAVHKGVNFLLSTQNGEGGWGECLESCPSMKYTPLEGNRTNLVQTSWAMLGLMYGGQVSSKF